MSGSAAIINDNSTSSRIFTHRARTYIAMYGCSGTGRIAGKKYTIRKQIAMRCQGSSK